MGLSPLSSSTEKAIEHECLDFISSLLTKVTGDVFVEHKTVRNILNKSSSAVIEEVHKKIGVREMKQLPKLQSKIFVDKGERSMTEDVTPEILPIPAEELKADPISI